MSNSDMRKLKQKRAYVKGQVTRMQLYFDSADVKSAADARVRLRRLEELWGKFEEIQGEIDARPAQTDEQAEVIQEEGEAERNLFESCYYKAAATAQHIIDQQAAKQQVAATQQVAAQQAASQHRAPEPTDEGQRRTKPKLPEIKLPEFSGDYTKWMFFKNSFETTIHSDKDLSPMQKHQYLVGILKGEALQVVQGFSISDENYENAWTLLKNTYDNQMLIIETHLDALLQFPNIAKDNKADAIRQFTRHIQTHLESLRALHQPVEKWDTIIIHMAKKRLDFAEQRDWQNIVKSRTPTNMPKIEEFLKFLTERCHTLRVLNQNKGKQASSEKPTTQKKGEKKVSLTTTPASCKICKGSHPIYKCEELLKQSVADRLVTVRDKKLCINCLNSGHYSRDCRSTTCKKCSKRHNTLLHREVEPQESESSTETSVVACATQEASKMETQSIYCAQTATKVILSTIKVHAYDSEGNVQACRALLDPGSQTNIITTSLTNKLKLVCNKEERPITGIGRTETSAYKVTQLRIKSIRSKFEATLECLVLPTITERLPQSKIDVKRVIIPRGALLADPCFDQPGPVDLLIGAGLYWKCLVGSPRNSIKGQPSIQQTHFGWIIGGEMTETQPPLSATCLTVTNEMLMKQIERFWTQEETPGTPQLSEEERKCEQLFKTTCKRDETGRFLVRLPARADVRLGNSSEFALKRFISLERRFARDPDLKLGYCKFMQDYLSQGHMTLVEDENQKSEHYVLPHQAVVRPDSVTTKLRVVFDASAKTTANTSLNDKLIAGPNLQGNLIGIILRFRTYEHVVTADIASMFRQILVAEEDRSLQQILWRSNPEEPVRRYQLNTVTYGTNCAPYLAIRCLRQLAEDDGGDLPQAAHAIIEDCYMDDVLSGARTMEEAIELQKQLSQLLKRGQFHLRKWRASSSSILEHLAEQCKTDELLILDKEGALKTLGLLWNAKADCLQYQVHTEENQVVTKRLVLSKIAQVFDPLGLIAPLLVSGKIIMQRLWLYDLDWDQEIPAELAPAWEDYSSALKKANYLQIPRNVIPRSASDKFDIFGFGDASEKAYGACLYAVSSDENGGISSHLICAKTKVAPLKTISVPRLELEAALLLAKLYALAREAYGQRINGVKLWTDSTIVLAWVRARPNELKTFVANRVAKIQHITGNIDWNHVPTDENPADLLSRGVPADVLEESELWWHGPPWLVSKNQMPEHTEEPEVEPPERKTATVALVAIKNTDLWTRFPTYCKLQRVIAQCHRFKDKTLGKGNAGVIKLEELERADQTIIKMVQQEMFSEDLPT
ncbi:PREDICTED: uncharacterized protein LOC105555659 [Vollenhovia emeryi]|uniref:uncharacterized protein LOC105555659 n=1 Tax=Vollenhovia emeryi TaxID=411798 RepID=UPI0005F43691|nr:PREDICTED: uncharacterized protein LOC105555659 [Vollenhovia emeryi]